MFALNLQQLFANSSPRARARLAALLGCSLLLAFLAGETATGDLRQHTGEDRGSGLGAPGARISQEALAEQDCDPFLALWLLTVAA